MTGLSDASFMGGLMQGYNFADSIQNRNRANDRADKQFNMAKKTHDQSTKLNDQKIKAGDQKVLLGNFDRDSRGWAEAGVAPTQAQLKEYEGLGVDNLFDPEWREKQQDAGAWLHRSMTERKWDKNSLDAFNITFEPELRAREKDDGLARKVRGVKETKDGRYMLMLDVTGKDGKVYQAPLTKRGSSDGDDTLVLFNEDKIKEIHEVQMHRANMAYMIDKAGGDPKKLVQAMRKIVLGEKETKAPALTKGGRGSNGKQSNPNGSEVDFVEYRKLKAAAMQDNDPERLKAVDALFEKTNGFTIDEYNEVRRAFEAEDRFVNPTHEEVRARIAGRRAATTPRQVDKAIVGNPELFGSNPELIAQQEQQELSSFLAASGDNPQDYVAKADTGPSLGEAVDFETGLKEKALLTQQLNALRTKSKKMPGRKVATPQEREILSRINTLDSYVNSGKETAKAPIMAELKSIRESLGYKPGRSIASPREKALIQAASAIDSSDDIGTINKILADIKIGSGSQAPDQNDSAHMAAL